MSKEKLKQIFIEEATEIIEKMDIDILNFEDAPSDKGLLNEIFRGVHTLKGSARKAIIAIPRKPYKPINKCGFEYLSPNQPAA